MIEELKTLSTCGKSWAEKRAKMALDINEQFEGGGLEDFEYQEMMEKLVESNKLDREADDLDTKALLVTAVYTVAGII